MWYHPPYSEDVSINMGREILNVLTKKFSPHHKYHKLFNRNNVKISNSAMPNMRAIIKGHNLGILTNSKLTDKNLQLQKIKVNCALGGVCLVESAVYDRTSTCTVNDSLKFKCIGICI